MAIQKTQTSDKVWAFLTKVGFSNIGAAALMGNIYAESGMIANRVEILCLKRLKENGYGNYTDASYTAAVGMFESVVSALLLLTFNYIAKKRSGTSIW